MKQIIIGQLMLWVNITLLVLGYYLFYRYIEGIGFLEVMCGLIGFVGTSANVVFAISVQVEGYQRLKIFKQE